MESILKEIKESGIDIYDIDQVLLPDIEFGNNEGIERFIGFLKRNDVKSIFYCTTESDLEYHRIDIGLVKEQLKSYYDKLRDDDFFLWDSFSNMLKKEEFDPYFDTAFQIIEMEIKEYNESVEEGARFKLEEVYLYCLFEGKTIGCHADNNTEGLEINGIREDFYISKGKEVIKQQFDTIRTKMKEENKRRYEEAEKKYKKDLIRIKNELKRDQTFISIKTKYAKLRYAKELLAKLQEEYPLQIATRISFREMMDDAIAELEKEGYKKKEK